MIPKRVTLENFLSFGEKQEIAFDHDEVLWVIGGPNGSGKSAVFDAMTYCLFGTHRASGTRIKDSDNKLIRHGENGFNIVFEFEFNGIDYRISRGRHKNAGRQPTPTAERLTFEGDWERVANVNTVKELDCWVVNTLGLNSDQFQASVLLRQGKADAFVDAKPAMRFEILKGIINMDQYESLATLVGEKLSDASREVRTGQKKLEGKAIVTPELLKQAETQVAEAEQFKLRSEETQHQVAAIKADAARWDDLQKKKTGITSKLKEVDKWNKQAEQIEKDHAHWKQLSETLPRIKNMVDLRAKQQHKETELAKGNADKAEQEAHRLEEATILQQLTDEIQQLQEQKTNLDQQQKERITEGQELARRLNAANDLADLTKQANAFPASIDRDLAAARESHSQAVYTQANAKDEVTRLRTIQKQVDEHHAKVSKMKVGVNCSACGQPVTAEHAEKERQQAKLQLEQAQHALAGAVQKQTTADQEAKRLSTILEDVQSRVQQKARVLDKLEVSRRNYQSLGELQSPEILETQVNKLRQQYKANQEALEKLQQTLAEREPLLKSTKSTLQALEKELAATTLQLQVINNELSGIQGQLTAVLDHLPESSKVVTSTEAAKLDAELRALVQRDIDQQHQQLLQSRNQSAILQSQLEHIDGDLNSIPEPARINLDQAAQQLQQATMDKANAEKNWQNARDHHQQLKRQAEEYQTVTQALAQHEHRETMLKVLDQKLGKKGLQLALMSDAQTQIVDLARQTLLQLSDHQLSLELNQPDGDDSDQALDLCVRNAENAHATPMEYLSGSQKFRVAIAIALAIGRYSAGQSRPLESVIIDEGFGSLDRDGLNSMAEELKELQRSQLLSRIILVSHQEEFVDRFPAGYTLTPGEAGTTARVWRR